LKGNRGAVTYNKGTDGKEIREADAGDSAAASRSFCLSEGIKRRSLKFWIKDSDSFVSGNQKPLPCVISVYNIFFTEPSPIRMIVITLSLEL
jgi:hypothetical protein